MARRRDEQPAPTITPDVRGLSDAIGHVMRHDAERMDLAIEMINAQRKMIDANKAVADALRAEVAAVRELLKIREDELTTLRNPARSILAAAKSPEPKAN